MRSVELYLRQKPNSNVFWLRRLCLLFALIVISGLWIVAAWSSPAARADGAGVPPPSSAPSSASPRIQEVPTTETGVYLGCQELVPSAELPQSGR